MAAAVFPWLGTSPFVSAAETASKNAESSDKSRGVKLGVASISLKDLPPASVATVLQQLEIGYVSIYRTHAPFEQGTPDACRAVADTFRGAGIQVATTSVVNLPNDEKAARKAFENVKAAGLKTMTCKPAPEALPLLDRLVKEYDIRLAIHNHGPEDKVFPSPNEIMRLVEPLDQRIGLSFDVGHCMRAKVDPAEGIRRYASRIYDVHLKDSKALEGAVEDIPVEVGRGRMNIKAILEALIEIKYPNVVAFEYERLGVNPVTGLAESVGYVRGILAGMTAS